MVLPPGVCRGVWANEGQIKIGALKIFSNFLISYLSVFDKIRCWSKKFDGLSKNWNAKGSPIQWGFLGSKVEF